MYPHTDSTGSRKNSPEMYRGLSSYESDPAHRTMRGRFETIFKAVWNIEMDPDLQAMMANIAATPSEAEASKQIERQARNVTAAQAPAAALAAEVSSPVVPGELNIDEIRERIELNAEPIGARGSGGVAESLPEDVVKDVEVSIDLPLGPTHNVGDHDGRLSLGA